MLKGADASKYQGTIDFDAVKSAMDFIMIRSSFGSPDNGQNVGQYTDVQFARNRDEARRVGVLHGYYHFSYSHLNSPISEANCFCDVVGTLQEGEILALDLEGTLNTNPVQWALDFLNQVQARTTVKPLIYISKSLTTAYDWSPVVNAGYGLWLAWWSSNQNPQGINTPWSFVAMLQWSDSGNIAGMNPVDTDSFNGDAEQFQRYGWHSQLAVQPVETPVTPAPALPPVVEPIVEPAPVEPPVLPEIPVVPETPAIPVSPSVELPGTTVVTDPSGIPKIVNVPVNTNWFIALLKWLYKLIAG